MNKTKEIDKKDKQDKVLQGRKKKVLDINQNQANISFPLLRRPILKIVKQ